MSIFREMAGYSYGHADVVRRAMSKKKADVLAAELESFLEGTKKNGISEDVARALFDDISSFARYAFNKSHAAAYAVISYRTAYLKAHYPCEYMSALMTSVLGNQTKLAEYIGECAKYGIRVLPPDINESRTYFHPHGRDIVFGLLALKNVGKQFVDSIISERVSGAFKDLEDFIARMSAHDINKRMVEGLIKSGAFDRLGVFRSRMLASYERLIDIGAEKNRSNIEGQLDMFSSVSEPSAAPKFEYPELEEFSLKEKLMLEKESSGMYFSGHMLDSYSEHAATLSAKNISEVLDIDEVREKQLVGICGIITSVTVKTTRKNEKMAFCTVEDRYGEIECLVFPSKYAQLGGAVRVDAAVFIEGNVSLREDEAPKLLVNVLEELTDNASFEKQRAKRAEANNEKNTDKAVSPQASRGRGITRLYLRVPDLTCREYLKAKNIVDIFEGNVRVYFYDAKSARYSEYPSGIAATEYILSELRAILGEANVVSK